MNRHLFLVKLVFCLLASTVGAESFEQLLGKGTPEWEYVRTAEDRKFISFYKRLYQKNMRAPERIEEGVAKKFHLIWLGPNRYPENSLELLEKWHSLHPDWESFFWCDVQEKAPFPWMVVRPVGELVLTTVEESYCNADNYKEKAYLLALEILHAEGGVYLDHDVIPVAPISFAQQLDFFAPLETLKPSIFSSSVYIAPYVLGGKKGHPFFAHAMQWYKKNGNKYRQFFPGSRPEDLIYRTQVRMYESIRWGVEKGVGKELQRDCVFPQKIMEQTAIHRGEGVWKQIETVQQQKMRQKVEQVMKNFLPLDVLLIVICVTTLFSSLIMLRRSG